MKKSSIANLRKNMKSILDHVAEGEEVYITKRNFPFVKITSVQETKNNKLKFGCLAKSGKILTNLTDPIISEKDWGNLILK